MYRRAISSRVTPPSGKTRRTAPTQQTTRAPTARTHVARQHTSPANTSTRILVCCPLRSDTPSRTGSTPFIPATMPQLKSPTRERRLILTRSTTHPARSDSTPLETTPITGRLQQNHAPQLQSLTHPTRRKKVTHAGPHTGPAKQMSRNRT